VRNSALFTVLRIQAMFLSVVSFTYLPAVFPIRVSNKMEQGTCGERSSKGWKRVAKRAGCEISASFTTYNRSFIRRGFVVVRIGSHSRTRRLFVTGRETTRRHAKCSSKRFNKRGSSSNRPRPK